MKPYSRKGHGLRTLKWASSTVLESMNSQQSLLAIDQHCYKISNFIRLTLDSVLNGNKK